MQAATPAAIALASRLVGGLVALVTLAVVLPRRNSLVESHGWHPRAWEAHGLPGHVARAGDRWDARWYEYVAQGGYVESAKSAAFFPLYPSLMAALHALGTPLWLAGTVLSTTAVVVAAVLLAAIASELPGGSSAAANRSVALWCLCPPAVVLGAIYPGSLLAALAAGAWLCALRGRRLTCGVLCGFAMLTKPLGVFVLAFLLLQRSTDQPHLQAFRLWRSWIGVGIAGLFAAVWPAWLWFRFGDPLRFVWAQSQWSRATDTGSVLDGVSRGVTDAVTGVAAMVRDPLGLGRQHIPNLGDVVGIGMQNGVNLLAVSVLLVGGVVAWRTLGAAAGAATLTCAVIPLLVPSDDVPLLSAPRFLLVALPLFVVLGRLAPRRGGDALLVGSAAGFGFATAAFTAWQWIG